MAIDTTSKNFFEDKYRASPDPWNFSSSPYELNRYDEIIRTLKGRTFSYGFEPGCSIGVLTERLASRCLRLLAMDISPTAVAIAQQRCARFPHVSVVEGSLSGNMPNRNFDLIAFSEIGYYFGAEELAVVRDSLVGRLKQGGVFVGVHWLGVSADHVLSGDDVQDILRASPELRLTSSQRHPDFLLESWERI